LACAAGTAAAGWLGAKANVHLFADEPGYRRIPDVHAAEQAWHAGTCLLRDSQDASGWRADACTIGDGTGAPVLLFGDSFAAHYVPGLRETDESGRPPVILYAMEGCPPVLAPDGPGTPACRAFRAQAIRLAGRLGVQRVIVAGSWLEYGTGISMQAESTLTALKAAGFKVTLIGQSPNFHIPPYMILARTAPPDAPEASLPLSAEARAMNTRLAGLAARSGADFIDPAKALCPDGACPVRLSGEDLYLDYGHFTPAGSGEAVQTYFPDMVR
jgi:hypothetical protein